MKRNPNKYEAMVLGKATVDELNFKCDNITVPLSSEIELLGVTVDNELKSENHICSICRKVSQQVAVLQRLKIILSFKSKKKISTSRSYVQISIIAQ